MVPQVPVAKHDPGGPATFELNGTVFIVGGPDPISTHGTFVRKLSRSIRRVLILF